MHARGHHEFEAHGFPQEHDSHVDHRIWQDVYRPQTARGSVYLKLSVIDDVLIVSFKEL